MFALGKLVDDEAWALEIVKSLGGRSGVVNALAFITGSALCAGGGGMHEIIDFVFDCFDFDGSHRISYDELVILIISCTSALSKMTKAGDIPTREECEDLAHEAFAATIDGGQSGGDDACITKEAFHAWICRKLGLSNQNQPRVILQELMVSFNMKGVSMPMAISGKDQRPNPYPNLNPQPESELEPENPHS